MMRWLTLLFVLVGMLAPAPAAAQTPGVGSFSLVDIGPTGARCRQRSGAGAPEGVVNATTSCTVYTDVLTAKRYRKVGTGTTGWRLDTLSDVITIDEGDGGMTFSFDADNDGYGAFVTIDNVLADGGASLKLFNSTDETAVHLSNYGGEFLLWNYEECFWFRIDLNGRPTFTTCGASQEMIVQTAETGTNAGLILLNAADEIGYKFISSPTGFLLATYADVPILNILDSTLEWEICGDTGASGAPLTAAAGGCPTWDGVIAMTSTATTAVKKAPVYVQNNLSNTTAGQGVGFWMQVADTAANDPSSACNTANPAAGDFVAYYACLETTAARDAGTIGVSAGLFGANFVLTAQNGENITMVGIEVDIQNLMGTGSTVPAAFAAESTVGVGVVMANTATPGDGSAGFATHINGGTSNQWKYGYEAAGVRNSSFYARRSTNAGNVDPVNVLYNETQADNFLYTVETGTHDYILRSTQGLLAAGMDIYGAGGSAAGRTTLAGVAPTHDLYEIGGASNAKYWRLSADGGTLNLQTVNDAYDTAGNVLSFPRSGNTPDAWYSATAAGFGTGATVSAMIHALATTEQLRLGYDVSNYFSATVGSTGGVTFNATGAGAAFTFSDAVTHSVAVTDAGATLRTGVISPTQLTGNTDNWNPTNLATANVIRANVDAARNITGIVAQTSGRWILLHNTTAFTITLVHDATSTAANRFYCPGAANFSLTQKMSVWIYYDGAAASGVGRWLVVS